MSEERLGLLEFSVEPPGAIKTKDEEKLMSMLNDLNISPPIADKKFWRTCFHTTKSLPFASFFKHFKSFFSLAHNHPNLPYLAALLLNKEYQKKKGETYHHINDEHSNEPLTLLNGSALINIEETEEHLMSSFKRSDSEIGKVTENLTSMEVTFASWSRAVDLFGPIHDINYFLLDIAETIKQPFFYGELESVQAEQYLKRSKRKGFIARFSQLHTNCIVFTRKGRNNCKHYRVGIEKNEHVPGVYKTIQTYLENNNQFCATEGSKTIRAYDEILEKYETEYGDISGEREPHNIEPSPYAKERKEEEIRDFWNEVIDQKCNEYQELDHQIKSMKRKLQRLEEHFLERKRKLFQINKSIDTANDLRLINGCCEPSKDPTDTLQGFESFYSLSTTTTHSSRNTEEPQESFLEEDDFLSFEDDTRLRTSASNHLISYEPLECEQVSTIRDSTSSLPTTPGSNRAWRHDELRGISFNSYTAFDELPMYSKIKHPNSASEDEHSEGTRMWISDELGGVQIDSYVFEDQTKSKEIKGCSSGDFAEAYTLEPESKSPVNSPTKEMKNPLNKSDKGNLMKKVDQEAFPEHHQFHDHHDFYGNDTWNTEFQKSLDEIENIGTVTCLEEKIRRYSKLGKLTSDFLYTATLYGKIIISEAGLPAHLKTIKPCTVQLGGLVGGEKYIVHSKIMFKFASLNNSVLGSNTSYASKVAGHDLKGLSAYFNCGVHNLRFPMMALIDYLGFRLIAMSLLPIDKTTIVYGSSDGGFRVHDSDTEAAQKMMICAKKLNLKKHFAGAIKDTAAHLYSAVDIEVHYADNKYYVLDFSRTFPPERPRDRKLQKGENFYRLLRPELVRAYHKPLCSDAFSSFLQHDPDRAEHYNDVIAASDWLREVVIPSFAKKLDDVPENECRTKSKKLIELLHANGINCRHLGLVRQLTKSKYWKKLILIEMIARVTKVKLRDEWRDITNQHRKPGMEFHRKKVISHLNLLFGANEESAQYWNTELVDSLESKFECALTDEEQELLQKNNKTEEQNYYSLRDSVSIIPLAQRLLLHQANEESGQNMSLNGKMSKNDFLRMSLSKVPLDNNNLCFLFTRVTKMLGLVWSSNAFMEYSSNLALFNCDFEGYIFDSTELVDLQMSIKKLNIMDLAQGYTLKTKLSKILSLEKQQSGSEEEVAESSPLQQTRKKHFSKMAITKFREALRCHTKSKDALIQLADVHFMLDKVYKANVYYKEALKLDPENSYNLLKYATFLSYYNYNEQAESFYCSAEKASETIEERINCLIRHANHICKTKTDVEDLQKAERLQSEAISLGASSPDLLDDHNSLLARISALLPYSQPTDNNNTTNTSDSPTTTTTNNSSMVSHNSDN